MRGILALVACVGLLTSCSTGPTGPVAGGDDFPNSRTGLGAALAQALSSTSSWDEFSGLSDTLPSQLKAESLFVPNSSDSAGGLGKALASAAIPGTVTWDYSDTASGRARAFRIHDDFWTLTSDTFVVVYDDSAKDTVFGNETVLSWYGIEIRRFESSQVLYWLADTDTNGYLDSATGISVGSVYGALGGPLDIVMAEARSGNDNSFTDASKTRLTAVKYFRLSGEDTLFSHELLDQDGDGVVLFTDTDSNIVRYRYVQTNSVATTVLPIRTEMSVWAELSLSPNLQLSLRRTEGMRVYADGSREQYRLAGTSVDSSLTPGDTALVDLMVCSPRADTSTLGFRVLLGSDILAVDEHALLSMVYQASNPADSVANLTLAFTADPPLTLSSTQVTGTLSGSVEFTDGRQGWLTATVTADSINATLAGSDWDTVYVHWDTQGTPID